MKRIREVIYECGTIMVMLLLVGFSFIFPYLLENYFDIVQIGATVVLLLILVYFIYGICSGNSSSMVKESKKESKEVQLNRNYNELFAELQKDCERKNCCNAFANITLEKLIELNYLLDRLPIVCKNVDIEELEDCE